MTKIVRYILGGIIAAVAIGVSVLCLLFGFTIYGYRAAIRAGNEEATLQNLKTIAFVEQEYYNSHSRRFGTFRQLVSEQLLSRKFDGDPVTVDGYVLTLIALPGSGSVRSSYTVRADPLNREEGANNFYLDSESTQIHVNHERPAGPDDPIW